MNVKLETLVLCVLEEQHVINKPGAGASTEQTVF